ncbi:unnamed protein product [Larinioides sclopetarius]|uniref:Uncharacterized protein n=1 Tax=Larinioides sclopetarius TaxID=280406 RepID=A0AAV1ZX37_9ARAC
MDDNNEMNGGIEHELVPGGHIFRCTLPVDNLATGKPCTLKQIFFMYCGSGPTKWVLEMIFQKAPHAESVPCSFTLKRDEWRGLSLNIIIEMCFTYIKHRELTRTVHFLVENLTDNEIQRSIADILPYSQRMDLNQGVLVGIEISILHCNL